MPKWLRDGISAIGSALIALALLFVAVAFGVAVNNQVGGPFWVALLSAIAFVLFVVLPLHLALVLHRARRRSGRDGPAAG
jgi:membrane protein implicated in regulation of membrane protease activity